MELGIYGLGRMGGNMAVRLVRGGHRVVASNRSRGPVNEAAAAGAVPAFTIEEMVLETARVAAHRLDDGAVRPGDRRHAAPHHGAAQARRHHHRRRQLQLSRYDAARPGSHRGGHALSWTAAPAAASGG